MTRSHALIAVALLAGCSEPDRSGPPERDGFGSNGRRQLTGLSVNSDGSKEGQTYGVYDVFRDHRGSGKAFADYGCATNCGDIQRGYEIAKAANITDMKQCTGRTWGELEGCAAFTQGMAPVITELAPLSE